MDGNEKKKCVLMREKSLKDAKRFGILAMTWTIVAFVSFVIFLSIWQSGVDKQGYGRYTLVTIAITTTFTASIFAGLAAFSAKKCSSTTVGEKKDEAANEEMKQSDERKNV